MKISVENFYLFFLNFAQNEAVLTSTNNLCFGEKIGKNRNTPAFPSFTIWQWGIRGYSLHGHVFLMIKSGIVGKRGIHYMLS